MSEVSKKLYGLLLAGGRSTRMGCDKATLIHPDGRSLAQRGLDLLGGICERVFLSVRSDQDLPVIEGGIVSILRDPDGSNSGPLVGIVMAMREQPNADWLVIACDLPRLDQASLEYLVKAREPGEMVLAYESEHDGKPEPLCAYYAAQALPILEAALAKGRLSPRDLLRENHCRLLSPPVHGVLSNANTPDEWQAFTKS
jgi:molybdopterin-guanine dinucleotide biosynthesis protein A